MIGVPDQRKGEEVCAWIKLKADAQLSEAEVKSFCQENVSLLLFFLSSLFKIIFFLFRFATHCQLAYFKVPRYYLFVDSFPLTSVGKAKKFEMRATTIKQLGLKEVEAK